MTARTVSITPPHTSTCAACGKTFIPPSLASHREAKTMCRACSEAVKGASAAAKRSAYAAACTTGTHRA